MMGTLYLQIFKNSLVGYNLFSNNAYFLPAKLEERKIKN